MVINSYKNRSHGLVESSRCVSECSSDDKGIAGGMDSSDCDWSNDKLNTRWKEFQKSAMKIAKWDIVSADGSIQICK